MTSQPNQKIRFQIDLDRETAEKIEKEARLKHATNRKRWTEHILTAYAQNL